MPPRNTISIDTNPPANKDTGRDERIIEFSANGEGGLINFKWDAELNRLDVTLYRMDPTVRVTVSHSATERPTYL